MFEPVAPDPPITSISEEQREALRSYFGNCVENGRSHRSHPLDFALMLAGEKPSCTMHPSEDEFPKDQFDPSAGLCQLCDCLNVVVHKPQEMDWWFVAPTEGRLDMLPSGNRCRRNEAWHRRLGVVLGYPPSVVEPFIDHLGGQEEWTKAKELVREGQFSPDEIANAAFVTYRHDDSIEGYEQAIHDGKRVRDRLEQLAMDWKVSELSTYVSDHFEHQLDEAQETVTP